LHQTASSANLLVEGTSELIMMPNSYRLFFVAPALLLAVVVASFAACNSSNVTEITNPVQAKVRAEPDAIDSGDRMDVEVEISDITVDRFAIKIRFPTGLSYVGDTSFYELNNTLVDTGPTTNVSDSSYNYLVYYTTRSNFGSQEKGSLWIVLEGVSDVSDGYVEVDIDIDNPDTSNSTEFDVSAPKFDAQSDARVQVGESGSASSSSSSSS
jgi:hypothetical protein